MQAVLSLSNADVLCQSLRLRFDIGMSTMAAQSLSNIDDAEKVRKAAVMSTAGFEGWWAPAHQRPCNL